MRKFFRTVAIISVIAIVLLGYRVYSVFWGRGVAAPTSITPGHDTTRITEPLRPDGSVDYVAALNALASQDVTPESNAMVALIRIFGPSEIEPDCREAYFKELGIPALPAEGDYFVSLEKYIKRPEIKEAAERAIAAKTLDENGFPSDAVLYRSWRATDYPLIADWLKVNDERLSRAAEAAELPRFYAPWMLDNEGNQLLDAQLFHNSPFRELARALVMRAMARLGEGASDAAWQDLLASHRLARLADQSSTLVEALLAMAINGMACRADQSLAQDGTLTAAQVLGIQRDFGTLSPWRNVADAIDCGERWVFLDATASVRSHGVGAIAQSGQNAQGFRSLAGRANIDWDSILKLGNAWYDRAVAGLRESEPKTRAATLKQLSEEMEQRIKHRPGVLTTFASMIVDPRKTASDQIGLIMTALMLPSFGAFNDANDRREMTCHLASLMFALEGFRADHGTYPAKLSELAPKYIAVVPQDLFSGGELIYTLNADGYLLYSVGVNGNDEGGVENFDDPTNAGGDDLTVRISRKTTPEASQGR